MTEIAIIGMSCRYPGANGTDEFWALVRDAKDVVSEVPASRFDIDAYYDPRPKTPGKIVSRWGGFLDSIDEFDAAFFGISPREAARMDPQQRLLLETAWEAIEDAGLPPAKLSVGTTGVFIGEMASSYWELMSRSGILDLYAQSGTVRSMLSGRLSYAFDLRGPSVSVDTACSSSLVAVHLACQSLRTGESSLALAAGVNLVLTPQESVTFSDAQMLSPDGRCKFGAKTANGFVRSEGVGVVVLKRLTDAVADGDNIHAVIRGSAAINDGRRGGYMMTPAVAGQEATLRAAYRDAGVAACEVDYVEAHGTGTVVGDPVELNALAAVLGEGRPAGRSCAVGSVKGNIGHTEAAAGMAGLIKTVLCLRHRAIPPSLHCDELTDAVDWDRLPLTVQRELGRWPASDSPALAAVSSFGITGTNAHVVVSEYRSATAAVPDEPPGARLLTLSAASPEALRALAGSYAAYLGSRCREDGVPLRDICYSAAVRRRHHESRLTVVGATRDEVAGKLRALLADEAAAWLGIAEEVIDQRLKVVFVFPGQGSQWVGMGRELLATSPVFNDALEECDKLIQAEAGWSVIERLTTDGTELSGIDVVQPALWAMGVGLAALWRSWGVEPDAVVGHSMGEVAAACVSGALSLADGAAVICRRSKLLRRAAGTGAMAAVELPESEAARLLAGYEDQVSVAALNSPTSTVLSGDKEVLDRILESLAARDIFCRSISVDVASHSPHMDPLRAELLDKLRDIKPTRGSTPIRSTVRDALVDGSQLDAEYWASNLREPVRFWPAVSDLAENGDGPVAFIEMSPHPILVPAVHECLDHAGASGLATGSLRRGEPEFATMLDGLAKLYREGHPIAWPLLFEPGCRFVRLPGYPWQRERFWLDAAEPTAPPALPSGSSADGRAAASHPLLGTPARQPDGTMVWQGPVDLGRSANAYLVDHRVQDTVILPGTAHLEIVMAAARDHFGDRPMVMSDIEFQRALFFRAGVLPVMRLRLAVGDGEAATFELSSREGDEDTGWLTHLTGRLRPDEGTGSAGDRTPDGAQADRAATRRRCGNHETGDAFYRRFAARGNHWGGAFQGIAELWTGDDEVLGRIVAPPEIGAGDHGYFFHPALFDACGQVLAALMPAGSGDGKDAFVLGGAHQVRFRRPASGTMFSRAVSVPSERADSFTGNVRVTNDLGELVVEINGLRLQYLERHPTRLNKQAAAPQPASPQPAAHPQATSPGNNRDWLFEVCWRRRPAPAPSTAGRARLVIFADSGGVGATLRRLLEAAGHYCVTVTPGSGYRSVTATSYQVDPCSGDDYLRLLADVGASAARASDGENAAEFGVVHLWGLDAGATDQPAGQALVRAEQLGCGSALQVVKSLVHPQAVAAARLWLVTRGAQRVSPADVSVSPFQAPLWGFGRVLAHEHRELRCVLVDLAAPSAAGAGQGLDDRAAADGLCRELLAAVDGDDQVALRPDGRYVARLARWDGTVKDLAAPAGAAPAYRVCAGEVGSLGDLVLAPASRTAPGPGEVEIRTEFAPLNFIDVLQVMGAYPGHAQSASPPQGIECAGTVAAVGDGVAGLRPGDQVLAFPASAMRTHVIASAHCVVPKPRRLSMQEAATLPGVFTTAYYALCYLARLKEGERVLIHCGTGGVGMAAIQVARWKGAEIFATAGSPGKRALLKSLGVEHVGDSRSVSFADMVREATRGDGVDVVLNALAGPAISENLTLLAPYGRYVEMTKRDLAEDATIGLRAFTRSISFFTLDVVQMIRTRPQLVGRLLGEIVQLAEAGILEPLPHQVYPATDAPSAFRHMAQARHIGKVMLSFADVSVAAGAEPGEGGSATPTRPAVPIRPDVSYLVTGGMGDLGLVVARWLAERGAKHILLTGRSQLPPRDSWLDDGSASPMATRVRGVAEIERLGAEVAYEAVDVADEDAMRLMLASRQAAGKPPVRGVVHAAGVASYQPIAELEADDLSAVLRPKLVGGWVLHRLFEHEPLDFFVLFSSGSAILSSPLLGSYAAANASLDALAHHRRLAGLPALSVNWGFWDSGMAARHGAEHGRVMTPHGIATFRSAEGTQILGDLLDTGATQVTVLPVDWDRWASAYPEAARSALYAEVCPHATAVHSVTPPAPPAPPALPAAAPAPPAAAPAPEPMVNAAPAEAAAPTRDRASTEAYLGRQVAKVLGLPLASVSMRRPLNRQGLDSLMAVEIRTHVQRDLGVMLPISKMLGGKSVSELADEILSDQATTVGESA